MSHMNAVPRFNNTRNVTAGAEKLKLNLSVTPRGRRPALHREQIWAQGPNDLARDPDQYKLMEVNIQEAHEPYDVGNHKRLLAPAL